MHALLCRYLHINVTIKWVTNCLLVMLADWLFFKQAVGWTSGLFVMIMCGAFWLHNQQAPSTRYAQIILVLMIGQVLALIENPNAISYGLITIGFIGLAFIQKPYVMHNVYAFITFICRYLWWCWFSVLADYSVISEYQKRYKSKTTTIVTMVGGWVVPIGLSTLFIGLFASANPVIDSWVDQIQWNHIAQFFSVERIVFWGVMMVLCWSIIRPRSILRRIRFNIDTASKTKERVVIHSSSIIRALILFNLIFGVQTSMDVAYLWGGVALPEGMTYAEYAHKGAYPLIFAALLSALFVLVALKPGSHSERITAIRVMVITWIGQNILLSLSSIWRIGLYVDAYMLTNLRVAAIIWMALVAFGLLLILIRIVKNKNNIWLMNMNFIALMVMLYICSFINFGGMIAHYNITHSKEVSGSGTQLDLGYLRKHIGVEALPALIDYSEVISSHKRYKKEACGARRDIPGNLWCYHKMESDTELLIRSLKDQLRSQQKKWRSWTFRHYRIANYKQ